MITKEQLLASMQRECDICEHLFSKLTPGGMEYRPSPDQRSTLELLRYLTICGIAGSECMAASDWKRFKEFSTRAAAMAANGFPAAMQRQKAELATLFDSLTEETLRKQMAPMPGGGEMPLGAAILNGPLKWLTSYKLQLFLYAKATGATGLTTANAWAGVDAS